jgi:26S proteasome regulatory subunit N5
VADSQLVRKSPFSCTFYNAASGLLGARAPKVAIVGKDDEDRVGWSAILRKRIVQHNIRVISKWYDQIRFPRICSLLGLDAASAEACISELAADKAVFAKLDRPAGIVVFARPRPATEALTDFTTDIDTVMALVEKTRHLIEKEYMVRNITATR